MSRAAASFAHLLRMSDDTGLLEHARGAVPRRSCGYCVDDVARGLVVVSREEHPAPEVAKLAERYLAFVAYALAPDGRCRNRLGYDRRWEDDPGSGDSWGRALWGLGTAATAHRDAWVRRDALECFDTAARCRSISPRAMAFATLGAAEILRVHPSHAGARSLVVDAIGTIGAWTNSTGSSTSRRSTTTSRSRPSGGGRPARPGPASTSSPSRRPPSPMPVLGHSASPRTPTGRPDSGAP